MGVANNWFDRVLPSTLYMSGGRKGTDGVSTGVTANQPTSTFPKVPGRTFFANLTKLLTFAAAPLVLTPFFRNQGGQRGGRGRRGRGAVLHQGYAILYYTII